MTWREFVELLGGLSAESRWGLALQADRERHRNRVTFASQREAEAFAASGYGMA